MLILFIFTFLIRYVEGDPCSFNVLVGRTAMASLTERKLEHPDHKAIRAQVAKARRGSAKSSVNVSVDEGSQKPDALQTTSRSESVVQLDLSTLPSEASSANVSYEVIGPSDGAQAASLLPSAPLLAPISSTDLCGLDAAMCAGISTAFADVKRLLSQSTEEPQGSLNPEPIAEHQRNLSTLDSSLHSEAEKVDDVVAVRGTQPVDTEVAIPVYPIWFESPDTFYVRTREESEMFIQLKRQMIAHFGRNEEPLSNAETRRATNFDIGYRCAVFVDFKVSCPFFLHAENDPF